MSRPQAPDEAPHTRPTLRLPYAKIRQGGKDGLAISMADDAVPRKSRSRPAGVAAELPPGLGGIFVPVAGLIGTGPSMHE